MIVENVPLTEDVYQMRLGGDTSEITRPGQFINIALEGYFLRRPISVSDWDYGGLTINYKIVGRGTDRLSRLFAGKKLEILSGLGNGFDTEKCAQKTAVIGGGIGVSPLYGLAKRLVEEGKKVTAILGFRDKSELVLSNGFEELGCKVLITTEDGSAGTKGFVTDALSQAEFDYFCACGPEPMLKAVCKATACSGQFSFEEHMGCGYGACMGCTCHTIVGHKRVCKDGPIFEKEELVW
jgi:dihydroorotate dehydrogenase electron transfer subunit